MSTFTVALGVDGEKLFRNIKHGVNERNSSFVHKQNKQERALNVEGETERGK